MSEASKGRVWTEESKTKLRNTLAEQGGSWAGKTLSDTHRRRISEAGSGENNPFYGRNHSEESRAKMSAAKGGTKCVWYGRKHTDETKEKIRQSNINSDREVLKGEDCNNSKLTVAKVREMRVEYNSGTSVMGISREFGISYSQTARVVKREAWKHVE